MSKRPAGSGGLRKRGATWQSTARDPRTGKQMWRTWPATMAKRQVERAHAEWVAEVAGGRAADRSLTVEAFLRRWLLVAGAQMTPTTRSRHRTNVELLCAEMGTMRLADVTTLDVLEVLARLGVGRAPSTVRIIRGTLGKACKAAVAWKLLPSNPVSAATLLQPPAEERAVPTPEQMRALVTGEADPMRRCLWALLCHTGARIGEVLVLRWADIDIDARAITIAKTLTVGDDGRPTVGRTTKTKRGRRVGMTEDLAVELRAWRQCCASVGLDLVRPTAHLFAGRAASGLIDRSTARDWWAQARDRVGMDPTITPHAVRHAVASLLTASGTSPSLTALTLGHSVTEVITRYGVHAPVDQVLQVVNRLPALHA